MTYEARILLDSLAPSGNRLTTWLLTYPRFVHQELLTHRVFSRNSASSRAIPLAKLRDRVREAPALPVHMGKNQKGMQAEEELEETKRAYAEAVIRNLHRTALEAHQQLENLGVHKQIANRYLEPWMWMTVILSGTTFGNFFALRDHPAAQPEIARLARMMRLVYENHEPTRVAAGQWHLPMLDEPERQTLYTHDSKGERARAIATGRIARVSYLTHDGQRDWSEDIALHDRCREAGHWSPFEHCGMALAQPLPCANFTGWLPYRALVDRAA